MHVVAVNVSGCLPFNKARKPKAIFQDGHRVRSGETTSTRLADKS